MERIDFDRRMALEKEIEKQNAYLQHLTVIFDEFDKYIIYPTIFGIKVIELKTG